MITLIPAYRPTTDLVPLVQELHSLSDGDLDIVIVDDGSGSQFQHIFKECKNLGCHVLTLPNNVGKGAALKHGFRYIQRNLPQQAVVTADADGQHDPRDILATLRSTIRTGDITLGVRTFDATTPLRSRFGNSATAHIFKWATGWSLKDTQTGLRAFPPRALDWVAEIPGDRYAYELNVLLEIVPRQAPRTQLPIRTIYEAGNPTSHFNPIQDSAQVWAPILRFAYASRAQKFRLTALVAQG